MINTGAFKSSFPEIRESIQRLCARFPGSYWQALDRQRTYPQGIRRDLDAREVSCR